MDATDTVEAGPDTIREVRAMTDGLGVDVANGRIPAEKMGTHTFTFDQIDEAYDVFHHAAANSALKVVITP